MDMAVFFPELHHSELRKIEGAELMNDLLLRMYRT
jgi:hypothetical protein